ncbi:MAG: LemA family protein [Bacilli bacterium]|nr:LemA family protein [Bacilli bacterium]
MENLGPVLVILAIILLILVVWFIAGYNTLQSLKIKINEAESGIDVALTKRYDLLTKMIEVVKGYAKHEKETLEEVIKLRNAIHDVDKSTFEQKQEYAKQMDQAFKTINVIVEQYPELKASENFKQLQLAIIDCEEHLQAARRVYNANVSEYNHKVQLFPSNIIAGVFKFKMREFFESEEYKRKDVEIKF